MLEVHFLGKRIYQGDIRVSIFWHVVNNALSVALSCTPRESVCYPSGCKDKEQVSHSLIEKYGKIIIRGIKRYSTLFMDKSAGI